ncbi:MAG: DNA internalization-like competence protein ComEC/Rec2 [Microgenomates bacterium 39_7]|nr:MAG: DNA internalization-like competence protein ComEC/Rec2 [Microgenomates bacterium 39_7]
MIKKLATILTIFTLGLIYQLYQQWPSENLEVVFCDVGQGDAILISHGSWQMLIDAGYNDQILDCLRKNIPFWDKTLEVVLATHTDHDHIGGLSEVFNNYRVKNIFLADVGESESYKNMLRSMQNTQLDEAIVKNTFLGQKIVFSSRGELLVLGPSKGNLPIDDASAKLFSETILSDAVPINIDNELSANERSIILLLKYFDFELLLMGDAHQSNELALIEQGLIKKVEGVKIGHHGSNSSTHEDFIKYTQPEFAVISCGLNNKFGHPSTEVLRLLNENQVQSFRTDEQGDLKLITNGSYYWIEK